MAEKVPMTAAERTAYLERQFGDVVAKFEGEKAKMTLDQRIATVAHMARLSTGISQSDAAHQRALKAALEANRSFVKIDAELKKVLRSPSLTTAFEGDEMETDDGRGALDPDELEQIRKRVERRIAEVAGDLERKGLLGRVLALRSSIPRAEVVLPGTGGSAPT